MNRRSNWTTPMGMLLVVTIIATLCLVTGAMADSSSNTAVSVNINTAEVGELASLPGIGTSKATAIVMYRSENGPFTTIGELTNVRGIGRNILEKIQDLIRTQ